MSRLNSLDDCKSGNDFRSYGLSHGATERKGKGSHIVMKTPKGGVVVPIHGNHDLGTGLRHKLIKAFQAIGIAVFFAFVYIVNTRTF